MTQPILETRALVKKYGPLTAVYDVSFSVEEGEIFGLLGPNGAGKSTLIAMLTGLFPPDSGTIHILGIDAVTDAVKVRHLIGLAPQELALYPTLSGRENLRFFGEMYDLSGRRLQERVDQALGIVTMTERAGDPVATYSGEMKRRLNLAVGLMNNPRLLFLDEPTTDVDAQSRNHIFDSIERLNRDQGITVLYTTRYMEEAERLCDRVAIIDHGQMIALDTPHNLVTALGGGIIQVSLANTMEHGARLNSLIQGLRALSQVGSAAAVAASEDSALTPAPLIIKAEVRHSNEALIQVIQFFHEQGIDILSVETLAPNLETVFLHLTGKSLRP